MRFSVKPGHKKALQYLLVLAIPLYWIASEVDYARSKSPSGIATVSDFYRRFGTPSVVRVFEREGTTYYHLSGHLPRLPWLRAFPSSRPRYVFDASGQFVEWCSDPGDDVRFQQRWHRRAVRSIEPGSFQVETFRPSSATAVRSETTIVH